MILALCAVVVGLIILVWSADRFVDGAVSTASHLGMPPLLIGMVIIGFGTSAPEMVVSALASTQGNPGLALGNAYGSNITNIALILGLTAAISPITVHSQILRKEMPILTLITGLTIWLIWDLHIGRLDALILMLAFAVTMGWSIWQGMRGKSDILGGEFDEQIKSHPMSMPRSLTWLFIGLVLLVASSRLLVWGAVDIAQALGVSDVIIGLTIVAIGTSLPELASALVAVKRGEHDLALGNVIGSNLFNTLAVVGIAGAIHPMVVDPEVLYRDVVVMSVLTLSLFIFGYGFRGQGRINRIEGSILLLCYVGYTAYLIQTIFVK